MHSSLITPRATHTSRGASRRSWRICVRANRLILDRVIGSKLVQIQQDTEHLEVVVKHASAINIILSHFVFTAVPQETWLTPYLSCSPRSVFECHDRITTLHKTSRYAFSGYSNIGTVPSCTISQGYIPVSSRSTICSGLLCDADRSSRLVPIQTAHAPLRRSRGRVMIEIDTAL